MCWPRNSGGGLVWWDGMGGGWDARVQESEVV
jgi:hypothetical protein